jgi:TRAP-type C4-dicarboxylate transport system substrate-binding protein
MFLSNTKEVLPMKQKRMLMVVLVAVLFVGLTLTVLPAGKAHAAKVTLKVANFFPTKAFQSTVLEEFCRDLEKRTNGQVKVDYFAGQSLLKAPAMFDGIVDGVADIGYSHVYYTAGRFLTMETCGLPLGYPSGWVASQVMNDFYENYKPKKFDAVKVLWWNASPNSAIATAKKPIRKLEDLKGLTIRAPGTAGEVIKALGGTPAPTPMMEVYDAISKGVIDGEASNFETLFAFKFAEVVKYSTSIGAINHPYPFYFVMNKNSYKKLPADIKPIFDKLVGEYKERYILMWNAIDFIGKAFGKKKGVEIIELPASEMERWKAAVEPVIDNHVNKLAKDYSVAEVRAMVKFLRDRSAYWEKKQASLYIPSAVGPPEIKPEAYIIK